MAEIIMIGCERTVEEMQRVMDEINQFYELVADVYNIDLNEEKHRASIVKSDLMKVVRKAESRDSIYAVVKRYAVGGDESTFDDWIYKPSNHDGIYDKIMELTDGDHEISDDAASWCKFATVGEIYEFREGEIEIMEFN